MLYKEPLVCLFKILIYLCFHVYCRFSRQSLYAATAEKNTSPVEATIGTTTKHNDQQQQLLQTPVVVAEIVNDAVKKVEENKVFNADLWDELKHYEYGQLTETEEFSTFKILFDGYLKNGDREKLYGKYYDQVPLKSTSFFRG